MKVDSRKLLSLFVILELLYAFTADTIRLQTIVATRETSVLFFVVPMGLLFVSCLQQGRLRCNIEEFAWILFLIVVMFSIFVMYGVQGFMLQNYVVWLSIILISLLISKFDGWSRYISPTIVTLSLFHAVAGWIMYFSPDFYSAIILSHAVNPYRNGLIFNAAQGALVGFANHYSIIGMYISIGSVIIFSIAVVKKKKKWYLLYLFMFVTLLMTQKRGVSLFGFITVALIYVIWNGHTIHRLISTYIKIILAICGGFVLLIILGRAFLPSVFGVFERTQDLMRAENISANRFALWNVAAQVIADNFLFGIGWGNFPEYTGLTETCSSYLEVLTSLGVIGFIPFMLAILGTFRLACVNIRIRRNQDCEDTVKIVTLAAFALQVLFLLYSFTSEAIILTPMYIPYFISCGMVFNERGCTLR